MNLQDLIFAVGSIVFLVALIPSILSDEKPSPTTSFLTVLVLAVFGATYITLHFWFSAATTLATGVGWIILLIQEIKIRNDKN